MNYEAWVEAGDKSLPKAEILSAIPVVWWYPDMDKFITVARMIQEVDFDKGSDLVSQYAAIRSYMVIDLMYRVRDRNN